MKPATSFTKDAPFHSPREFQPSVEALIVLVVEDNPGDARLVREHLSEDRVHQFEITVSTSLAEAFAFLESNTPQSILLDLSLPDSQGLDTFTRMIARTGNIPIVILTGTDDDALAMEAIHRGAQDYVIKGESSGGLLVRALRYAMERKRLEDQLRQTQRLDAIGQLAGGVAHDFNNILHIIEGYCGLCLSEPDVAPNLRGSLEQIRFAAERAANLTRQLLAFGRRQFMRPRPLDVDQVIQSTSKMFKRVLGEPISLRLSCATDLPLVRADQGMMEQLILNLIVNARDAMPKGGEVTIGTSLARIDESRASMFRHAYPGDFVRIRVEDTGAGIRPEILPRIFEPFFTTKEVGQGSGLGLATVYGIVQQHAGWITAQSQPGHGTQFDVYLPVSYESGAKPEAIQRADFTGKTALAVEDEPSLRRLVAQVLEQAGFQVFEADDGQDALQIWKRENGKVDLLLTDMVMPGGMSGRELADRLKKENASLRVIYTSGYFLETSRDAANGALNETNFLKKPYAAGKLLEMIRQQFNRHETG